ETVAQQVKSDWLSEQRSESKRTNFDALKARYEVVMTMPASDADVATIQTERP
ncbi:MAG TPA: peptidyl-prolyl cis-trans isomerase, partial [Pseudomonas sp.]|nr:peptidyl-prolyl cis-trans isomerase [Pseudomonas sp.]